MIQNLDSSPEERLQPALFQFHCTSHRVEYFALLRILKNLPRDILTEMLRMGEFIDSTESELKKKQMNRKRKIDIL